MAGTKIPLYGKYGLGKFAIVDDEDIELVMGMRWHLSDTGYAVNRTNKGYQARLQTNGKRLYLGTFATIEEAHKAYLDRKRG